MNFWCKLFNIILGIWNRAVEAVGFALKTVGTVLVDTVGGVVGEVGEVVGSLLGIDTPLVFWLLIGGGAWFLLSKNKDDSKEVVVRPAQPMANPYPDQYSEL